MTDGRENGSQGPRAGSADVDEAAAPRIDAPAVVRVRLRESGEELVDLGKLLPILLPSQLHPPPLLSDPPPFLARAGVAARLRKAVALLPADTSLVVVSAFRTLAWQRRLFASRLRQAGRAHPEWSRKAIAEHVRQFVADPSVYAPHCTGGAIDVMLAGAGGEPLDLGGIGMDPAAATDYRGLSAEQQRNRAALVDAMRRAGFENYPFEWWHWSFGEKYWGCRTGHDALYGYPTRAARLWQAIRRRAARFRAAGRPASDG